MIFDPSHQVSMYCKWRSKFEQGGTTLLFIVHCSFPSVQSHAKSLAYEGLAEIEVWHLETDTSLLVPCSYMQMHKQFLHEEAEY